MLAPSLLSTLFFTLAVATCPFERKTSFAKLPFQKRFSESEDYLDIVRGDRRRADIFKGNEVYSSPAKNIAVSYVASVGVGSPPTTCKCFEALSG